MIIAFPLQFLILLVVPLINSVVNAAVNSVDNGGVELTQRVIINSFDVDLNAIWQTTAEGTQENRRDHNITVSRASTNIEKENRK